MPGKPVHENYWSLPVTVVESAVEYIFQQISKVMVKVIYGLIIYT